MRAAWFGCADAGLGDDVDDAADRAVAVEHRAAIAARDLDALDRFRAEWRRSRSRGRSKSLKRRPLIRTSVLDGARSRRSRADRPRRARRSRRHRRAGLWMPASRERMSAIVCRGERAMSSAVMMVVDVPVMPPLPRRLSRTSIVGSDQLRLLRRMRAVPQYAERNTIAAGNSNFSPITHTSFIGAPHARSHRVEDRTAAKDDSCNATRCEFGAILQVVRMSWEVSSHGLRTGHDVTAAKDRSVWTSRPPVG